MAPPQWGGFTMPVLDWECLGWNSHEFTMRQHRCALGIWTCSVWMWPPLAPQEGRRLGVHNVMCQNTGAWVFFDQQWMSYLAPGPFGLVFMWVSSEGRLALRRWFGCMRPVRPAILLHRCPGAMPAGAVFARLPGQQQCDLEQCEPTRAETVPGLG